MEEWRTVTRALRGSLGFVVTALPISAEFWQFLKGLHGAQFEELLLSGSGEHYIDRLKAYVSGFSRLTSTQAQQWLGQFYAWSGAEQRRRLAELARSSNFYLNME